MNEEAVVRAKEAELEPRFFEDFEDFKENVRYIPQLGGGNVPKGYELVKEFFVDNSGMGAENEPALTFEQFIATAWNKDWGYGITDCGQFQIYVGAYKKV
jgi:hypothetical protein